MTYDRSAIMKAAWTIVRRFARSREPLRQKLARALRCVWWDARQAAAVAARVAAEMARIAAAVRPAEEVRAEIFLIECKDRLEPCDWRRLDALRAELRAAA
ncbi:hypothetical protein CN97_00130 [Haematobacter massiliensis]|uniref:Uncharacterized protein n=1 Tax=Haematobacter massiliensis TaxID=195105 RepID=A0A086Y0G1_9RHOB|nr:hypothetical protein [Haematobacter massiliensis]KFI27761.1 hypothetical protein CN97_00130 [Haematobacter massiliensis]OWJ82043.1 hypothetical protein CDV51_18460 [Haematobacter massiliensis]QBJ24019.1 hypothetical protein HmaOT1_06965 [Haematobacter massiliensis]